MFICYYCHEKKEHMAYIETKKYPCCAKCEREKKIKDDPKNPYTIANNKWKKENQLTNKI